MVRRKYTVNLPSAMLTSTKTQVAVGVAVILSLAFLSSLVYLFLKEPASTPANGSAEEQNSNSSVLQQHYRQQFVRNMTAQLWQRQRFSILEKHRNSSAVSSLADLRLTFAVLTSLKVMQLDNQFDQAKQTIVRGLLQGGGADLMGQADGSSSLQPVDLVNEYLAALLSASALESEDDDDDNGGDSKQELLQVATTRLMPLIEQYYQWGNGLVFYKTDNSQGQPSSLAASDILAHYPIFNQLANVTSTSAYRNLVTAFENVFNFILLHEGAPQKELNGILLPLPVNLADKAYQFPVPDPARAREKADVGQLAASLLAIHLQAPNTSLQMGRIERLFDFIKANLTSEWKTHFLYAKSFFDYTLQKEELSETDVPWPMHFSQCNLGSTLALGAKALKENLFALTSTDDKMRAKEEERYRDTALTGAYLVATCHQAATEHAGSRFYLLKNGSINPKQNEEHFDLRYSQLAEAYFVLHRLTGDPIYREYAWQLTQALHRQLLLTSQTQPPLPPQFWSATLKWLYLVQGDQLPLDRWLFSQPAGHPLPILGAIDWEANGYDEDADDALGMGASFYRPGRGRSQRRGAIIISESPDLN